MYANISTKPIQYLTCSCSEAAGTGGLDLFPLDSSEPDLRVDRDYSPVRCASIVQPESSTKCFTSL